MHPILARPGRLLPYLAACAPLAAIVTALLARPGGLFLGEAVALAIPLTVAYAFMGLSPWYVCRQFPLKKARIVPLVVAHALAAALIAALWVGFAAVLAAAYGVAPAFQGLPGRFASQAITLLAAGFLLYLLSGALNYVLLALQAASERGAEGGRARDPGARGRARGPASAQIRPHFLFNSLNSISALASTDPPKAQEMCVRLARVPPEEPRRRRAQDDLRRRGAGAVARLPAGRGAAFRRAAAGRGGSRRAGRPAASCRRCCFSRWSRMRCGTASPRIEGGKVRVERGLLAADGCGS